MADWYRGILVLFAVQVGTGVLPACGSSKNTAPGSTPAATGGTSGSGPMGGAPTGGRPTGGASMGGVSTGGASTGGAPMGGASTGGTMSAGAGGESASGGSGGTQPVGSGGANSIEIYTDFTNADNWRTFDLANVPALTGSLGFRGGTFDGRYVYLAPYPGGTVARYDTTQSFGSPSSWSGFSMNANFAFAKGYVGAVLVDSAVYLSPHFVTDVSYTGYSGQGMRFNTAADFSTQGSWTLFSINTAPGGMNAFGFLGAVSDGRYVYYAPYHNENVMHHGIVARYDTQTPFDMGASWSYFDAANHHPGAKGFYGALSAGGFLYLVPHANPASHGLVTRYRESAPFALTTSWTTFDVTIRNASARGFIGAGFDGRNLYLVPHRVDGVPSGVAVKYDTEASFTTGTSWQVFDIATLDPGQGVGFAGAGFDGRYMYYVPLTSGAIFRYDTTQSFQDAASWQRFDTVPLNAQARDFFGAVFDGEYLYFLPADKSVVARFRARQKGPLPAFYRGGSFF